MISSSIIKSISRSFAKPKKIKIKLNNKRNYSKLNNIAPKSDQLNKININNEMDISIKKLDEDLKYLNEVYDFFINNKHKTLIFDTKYGLLNYDHYLKLEQNIALLTLDQQMMFKKIRIDKEYKTENIIQSYNYFCNFVDDLRKNNKKETSTSSNDDCMLIINKINKYHYIFTPEEIAIFNDKLNYFNSCHVNKNLDDGIFDGFIFAWKWSLIGLFVLTIISFLCAIISGLHNFFNDEKI